MVNLTIRGAEQLGHLARDLRAAGESGKGLRRELYRGINRTVKPIKAEAQRNAGKTLPQSGGLAALVAKSRISTRTRSGREAGVSLVVKDTAATTDRGYVKHPVFGNREAWARQPVRAGWFTNTMRASAPTVRRQLLRAMSNVANKIGR